MQEHQDAVQRVAEVPGFGLDSALQMIAEVGPKAAAFEVAKALSSWVGVCPGNEESAGESHSTLAEGQPPHAAAAGSGGTIGGKGQRKHI
jgi:transposase